MVIAWQSLYHSRNDLRLNDAETQRGVMIYMSNHYILLVHFSAYPFLLRG